jgi:hypothetical protein
MASLLQRVARPVATIRRVRELGFGLSAFDLLGKRYRIAPVTVVGPMMRALRIIGSPLDFLRRKRAARKIVRIARNPFKIPEQLGYRTIKPNEFPEHLAALNLCQNILRDRANILAENPNTYGIDLLATDGLSWTKLPLDYRQRDTLLDLALSPKLIAAAAEYLGEIPTVESLQLYCTTGFNKLEGNNFYHFDKDHRMVKFWMAINEIDDDTGPFTFLPANRSDIVRKQVGYYGRLTDEKVYAAVPASERIEFKGQAGSMLLVDTCRCVHYGSRTRKGPRAMLLIQYQSRFAWFENAYYFQPVIYNRDRYRKNRIAAALFAHMREKVLGRRATAAS